MGALIAWLVGDGHGDCILLSQDVGTRTRLHFFGCSGQDQQLRRVVPMLRAEGLDDATVHQLLVECPRRLLTVARPGSRP